MVRFLVIFWIAVIPSFAVAADEVRMPIGDYYSEPFFILRNGIPVDGLLYRLANAAAEQAGLELELINLPRKRLDSSLARGEVDFVCHAHPAWFERPESLLFVEIYQSRDVYVTWAEDGRDYQTPGALSAATIGTILGYHYPSPFADAFKAGAARVEVNGFEQLAAMLLRRRIDALVITDIIAEHLVASSEARADLVVKDAGAHSAPRYCAIRKDYSQASRLAEAIGAMRKNGEISAILQVFSRAGAQPVPSNGSGTTN